MPKPKPWSDEPGRYCGKHTPDGWFLIIDYVKRLSAGGAAILRFQPDGSTVPNEDPWLIWHPSSGHSLGFPKRQKASVAFSQLCDDYIDVGGILAAIRGASGGAAPDDASGAEVSVPTPAGGVSSGSYGAEFARLLAAKFPPDLLLDRLDEQMHATYFSAVAGEVPDWPARHKGIELCLAYQLGRPIERQQVMQATAPMSWEALLKLAEASPVFRDTLLGMLESLRDRVPVPAAGR